MLIKDVKVFHMVQVPGNYQGTHFKQNAQYYQIMHSKQTASYIQTIFHQILVKYR